jgi:AcrR family transcriptional regulator
MTGYAGEGGATTGGNARRRNIPRQGDRIFSASNHHFINACMPRWEPDARERLVLAALQSFSEQGYDETTAAVIAGRPA